MGARWRVVMGVTSILALVTPVAHADNDQQARALYEQGGRELNSGAYDRALADFERATQLVGHPNLRIQPSLVRAAFDGGRYRRAAHELEVFFSLDPNPDLVVTAEMRDIERSVKNRLADREQLLAEARNDPQPNSAEHYVKRYPRDSLGKQLLKEKIEAYTSQRYQNGEQALRAGKLADAKELFESVVEWSSSSYVSQAWERLGTIREKQRQADEKRRQAEEEQRRQEAAHEAEMQAKRHAVEGRITTGKILLGIGLGSVIAGIATGTVGLTYLLTEDNPGPGGIFMSAFGGSMLVAGVVLTAVGGVKLSHAKAARRRIIYSLDIGHRDRVVATVGWSF